MSLVSRFGPLPGVVFAACLFTSSVAAQTVFNVDDDASYGGNGLTWGSAMAHLQDALHLATAGDEIHIAGGIYTPDQDEAGHVSPRDRTATFQLVDGVAIIGGYAGPGQPDPADQRNIWRYATILSGDLAGNDALIRTTNDLPNDETHDENILHLVAAIEVGPATVLDGLTIYGGCAFEDDRDGSGGGMIMADASPRLVDCIFSGNLARRYGAGIYAVSSSPTLTRCSFETNLTDSYGGGAGMYITGGSHPTLTDCTFSWNFAGGGHGGGMLSTGMSSPKLTDCLFYGNGAPGGGGMGNAAGSFPTLVRCAFLENRGISGAGMLLTEGSHAALIECTFTENKNHGYYRCGGPGGGLLAIDSSPTLIGCAFGRNEAHQFGGGVALSGRCWPVVVNCLFEGNVNDCGQGGGLSSAHSDIDGSHGHTTLLNCAFVRNRAVSGGALAVGANDMTITNCTFAANVAMADGAISAAGYGYKNTGSLTLTSCIVWGNQPSEFLPSHDVESVTVSHSCIEGGFPGDGNIDLDPLLTFGGYHLLADSPCIDAAAPASDDADQLDMDFEPRVVGAGVDMGADEWVDSDADAMPDFWELAHSGSPTSMEPDGDQDGDRVFNVDEYADRRDPHRKSMVYFAAPTGDDAWDGLTETWNGAHGPKATIQAAIDGAASWERDQILLADGVYQGPGNVEINTHGKRLTIRSVDGPDHCIVDSIGLGTGFTFESLETDQTVLDGLTITNSSEEMGRGIVCQYAGPTLRNCIISHNKGEEGGGIFSSSGASPTLIDCTIAHNVANTRGGGAYMEQGNPVFTRCTFVGNRAEEGGAICTAFDLGAPLLRGCLLAGNSATVGGAVHALFAAPALHHCTITANRAQTGAAVTDHDGSPALTNCIVWGNAGGSAQFFEVDSGHGSISASHSCVQGGWPGEGNTQLQPSFVSPGHWNDAGTPDDPDDDFWIEGNLRLTTDSRCIDAGDPNLEPSPDMSDLDGRPRVLCGRVDMGAYESGIGDADCDQAVTLYDFSLWQDCKTGPSKDDNPWDEEPILSDTCRALDFNNDNHVDLSDFAAYARLESE